MLCVCERVTDLWAVFQVAATARMASLQVSLFRRPSFWHKLPKLTISHQSARRGLALSQLSMFARNTCGLLPERAPSTADQGAASSSSSSASAPPARCNRFSDCHDSWHDAGSRPRLPPGKQKALSDVAGFLSELAAGSASGSSCGGARACDAVTTEDSSALHTTRSRSQEPAGASESSASPAPACQETLKFLQPHSLSSGVPPGPSSVVVA